MKRLSSLLLATLSIFVLAFTGCQTAPTQIDRGYTTPAQPASTQTQWRGTNNTTAANTQSNTVVSTPRRAVVATPSRGSDVIMRTNQIKVTKRVLEAASVGGSLKYRITIDALDDVNNVRLTESIPAGVQFQSANPAASLAGSNANWNFASMRKGQSQDIDITVKPTTEGDHQICSTVTVDNAFCLDFFAGQPKLDVVKKGPQSIELGEEASWTVTVTNSGSAEATNVIVTDTLPDAFTPTSNLRQPIGNLAPGETKSVTYTAKAVKQGNFSNRAVASYDGGQTGGPGQSQVASSPIAVVQSGIRVRKTGPSEAYVFKPVTFDITIENTGDTDLKNVRITDILPKGASVSDNGRGRVSGNAIGWMIPNLPAGSSQLIRTEIAATRKGESTNTVKVLSENGLEASDSVTTNWLAVPGVTVSITDSKDPVRVREATVYTIQVRNQGEFEPVTGTVTVTFNDKIKPTSVAGDAQGTINGQTVTFPRTTLEPGKDTNLSITAEGSNIGPGRAAMNFSADFLSEPIISQETTNVY
ncbi:CARDB domain-containing protein [Coraliomargarita sp. W4R53]